MQHLIVKVMFNRAAILAHTLIITIDGIKSMSHGISEGRQ